MLYFQWITSAKGVWISTGFFAVDTFFTLAGILLVYSSMGKMNGGKLKIVPQSLTFVKEKLH